MYSCRTGRIVNTDLKNIICEIEKVNSDNIRLQDNLTWDVLNKKANKSSFNSSESLYNYFNKRKIQYNIVNDTIEKWKVNILDSLRFVKSTNMRINNGNYIHDIYNLELASIIRSINANYFMVHGNFEFDNSTNYYYDPNFYFVKPRYPIKVEYFGILKDSCYVFDYDIPLHFQNNHIASYHYYRTKYAVGIDQEFIINKNIYIKKIKKRSDN